MYLFHRIPAPPDHLSATTALVRCVDGLGFRFRWATEGLVEHDYRFRPTADARSIAELVEHIWGLVNWVSKSVGLEGLQRTGTLEAIRSSAIEMTYAVRTALTAMGDTDLAAITVSRRPFWHLINGPIADALTHVGQINTMRRLAGNPTPDARVFDGLPPAGVN